jgi:hypothetical protein
MDDDGYMDVVLPCYYDAGAHVYQGGGGGLLNVDTPALIANPDEAIFFDADGDEHLDIAAVSVGNVGVTVGHNDGTNHFAAEDMIILGHATELARIASGDFDGNGYDDLVGGHGLGANSRLWVFLNFP